MWESKKINTLLERRKKAYLGGGIDRIEARHEAGKMTARERIDSLFDEDSFVELNTLSESRCRDFDMKKKKLPGDGCVTGYGYINGRLAFASSQDFTVNGGSLGEEQAKKICAVMDKALEVRAPFVSINDSGGARIEEGIDSLAGYGEIFYRHTQMSGVVPQIAVIMGPCAGGACYAPALCDFIFMTKGNSQMYITGPAVIKAVTGEDITTEELGGSSVHSRDSGVAHFVSDDDETCLDEVRELFKYIPQNNESSFENTARSKRYFTAMLQRLWSRPKVPGQYIKPKISLTEIVPDNLRKAYNMKEVIEELNDADEFIEIQKDWAKNIIIGFIKMGAQTVGIVANQPEVMAGALDFNASDKAARFVRFCDCFNIPILTLVDVPAFFPGSTQEKHGIIRHGAKLLYAFSESTVPKVSIILRKAYGGAYIAMNSKALGADVVYAWPIAEIAVMGADGAANIIGKKRISQAADKDAEREAVIKEYEDKFMNPYIAAARGYVDEVILPEETKERIVSAFIMLSGKTKKRENKKHGNIPL